MKYRKTPVTLAPTPTAAQQYPGAADPEAVQAATAIAGAINQGLPAPMFCILMNGMDPATVKKAAGVTMQEVMDWFRREPGAKEILDRVPTFPEFCRAFHAKACEIYPNAPRPATL